MLSLGGLPMAFARWMRPVPETLTVAPLLTSMSAVTRSVPPDTFSVPASTSRLPTLSVPPDTVRVGCGPAPAVSVTWSANAGAELTTG